MYFPGYFNGIVPSLWAHKVVVCTGGLLSSPKGKNLCIGDSLPVLEGRVFQGTSQRRGSCLARAFPLIPKKESMNTTPPSLLKDAITTDVAFIRLPSSKRISRKMNEVYYRRKLLMYVTISSHTYARYTMSKAFGALILDFRIDLQLWTPILSFKCIHRGVILSDHLLKMFLKQTSH